MTYKIVVTRTDVSWWRRLLGKHRVCTVEKPSQDLMSGTTGDARRYIAEMQDFSEPRVLIEPMYDTEESDELWSAVIVIEESELYS
tara:strand:+ start:252 stop:509 length:258 start_codon:yes stop_codon:yes gene_type:complete